MEADVFTTKPSLHTRSFKKLPALLFFPFMGGGGGFGGLFAPLRCLSLQITNICKFPTQTAIPNVYFCRPTPATASVTGLMEPGTPALSLPLSTVFLPLTHTAPAAMTGKAVFPPRFIRYNYRRRRFYHQRPVGAFKLE